MKIIKRFAGKQALTDAEAAAAVAAARASSLQPNSKREPLMKLFVNAIVFWLFVFPFNCLKINQRRAVSKHGQEILFEPRMRKNATW